MRGSSTKKPRALRPSQILPKWSTLQLTETLIDAVEVSKARGLSQDPVEFFRRIVGFEPTSCQKNGSDCLWRTSSPPGDGVARARYEERLWNARSKPENNEKKRSCAGDVSTWGGRKSQRPHYNTSTTFFGLARLRFLNSLTSSKSQTYSKPASTSFCASWTVFAVAEW
jgi:hypothetical protein